MSIRFLSVILGSFYVNTTDRKAANISNCVCAIIGSRSKALHDYGLRDGAPGRAAKASKSADLAQIVALIDLSTSVSILSCARANSLSTWLVHSLITQVTKEKQRHAAKTSYGRSLSCARVHEQCSRDVLNFEERVCSALVVFFVLYCKYFVFTICQRHFGRHMVYEVAYTHHSPHQISYTRRL